MIYIVHNYFLNYGLAKEKFPVLGINMNSRKLK